MWELGERVSCGWPRQAELPYRVGFGDAAFYGPKIDFDSPMSSADEADYSTIQVDFHLPSAFGLKYIGADDAVPSADHDPSGHHRQIRTVHGLFDRVYGGAFPLWLAPVQVAVLPIADRHNEYARSVRDRLVAAGLRVELDERFEKIGYKIREAQLQKIPYMLVTGDREAAESTVAVRSRLGGDLGAKPLDAFIEDAIGEVKRKQG